MNTTTQLAALAGIALTTLSSCAVSSTQLLPKDEGVYALGSRGEFASPLRSQMTPACPALEFARGSLSPNPQHDRVLQKLVEGNSGDKTSRFVIAAYCRPSLPPEYARSLSEKRAHAVRQELIKLGVRPADIQTAGFGNDFARSGPTGDVVVIYNTAP